MSRPLTRNLKKLWIATRIMLILTVLLGILYPLLITGIGQLAWQAIQRVDIPVIVGVTMVSAVGIVLGNLLADLVAPLIDPRIRLR